MRNSKYWLGLLTGLPIGIALYFLVVAALPALGAKTWIVLDNPAATTQGAKKY